MLASTLEAIIGKRKAHGPYQSLDLRSQAGTFLVRTKGHKSWYTIVANANRAGEAVISGGGSNLTPFQRVINDDFAGCITVEEPMYIQGRTKSFPSSDVVAIYDITGWSSWKIWLFKRLHA